jgi:oligopeptide/dipeptide ABC transporter ATP-binding protein
MLEVAGLAKLYPVASGLRGRRHVHAVDGVDLSIGAGETLGLVGESGSGKSTVGRCILRLEEPTRGTVSLDGAPVALARGEALRRLRRHMQMVYQDPLDSLNPRMRIGAQVAEPIWLNGLASKADAKERVGRLLEMVGMPPASAARYPHQFSGGQLQRIAIARALAPEPKLLILDEPTASLDVSIQAQIVELLADLQQRLGIAYLLISHDLPLVSVLALRVAVMYMGLIVEIGPVETIFQRPAHPYTRALLSATPKDTPDQEKRRILLQGEIPSPIDPPATCRLYPRCPYALPRCLSRPAGLVAVAPDHATRCIRFLDEHRDGHWEPDSPEERETERMLPLIERGPGREPR